MVRTLVTVAFLAALAVAASPRGAEAKGEPAWIEGGDLPGRIEIPWELPAPSGEQLDAPPREPGTPYRVNAIFAYAAARAGMHDVEPLATYYPAARAALITHAGGDKTWLRPDKETAGLLDVLISLGRSHLLPDGAGSELEILVARVGRGGENGAVYVGGQRHDGDALWAAMTRHRWPELTLYNGSHVVTDQHVLRRYAAAADGDSDKTFIAIHFEGPDRRSIAFRHLPSVRRLFEQWEGSHGQDTNARYVLTHRLPDDVAAELDALFRPEPRTDTQQAAALGAFALIGGLGVLALVAAVATSFASGSRGKEAA